MPLTRTVLEIAPTNLAGIGVSSTQVNLSWTLNPRASGYKLYRNGVLIASPTGNTYSDTGLAAATPYNYAIASVGTTGQGPTSSSIVATTSGTVQDTTAPSVPGTPVITVLGDSDLLVNWAASTDAVGVTAYQVDRATGAGGAFATVDTVSTTSHVSSGLTAQTVYRYRVRARDAAGNWSAFSAISQATTQAPAGGVFGVLTRSAINIEGADVWTNDNPYIDIVKRGGPWFSVSGCTVRSDGWLENIAPGGQASFYTHLDQDPYFGFIPTGPYVAKNSQGLTMTWLGSAAGSAVASTTRATCTVPAKSGFQVPPTQGDFGIRITNNTGSTISLFNTLKVFRVADEASVDAGAIWRPEKLAAAGNAAVIRTMTLSSPNIGGGDWYQKDQPGYLREIAQRSYSDGYHVPYGACANFAASLNRDLWVTFPYCVDSLTYELDAVNNRVYPLRTEGTPTGRFTHGWAAGTRVCFPTEGTFTATTGIPTDTFLYIRNADAQSFQLSTTASGAIDVTLLTTTGTNVPYSYVKFTRVFSESQILDHYRLIAQQIKANYNSTGRIYVEWGNEPWNSGFSQFQFIRGYYSQLAGISTSAALTTKLGGGNAYGSLLAWKVMMEYFPRSRLVFTLNGQAAWFDLLGNTGGMFDYVDTGHVMTGRAVKDIVDEYAIAPYTYAVKPNGDIYGINPTTGAVQMSDFYNESAATQPDSWWDTAFNRGNTMVATWVDNSVTEAKALNSAMRVSTYETNQHIFLDVGSLTAGDLALAQRMMQYCDSVAGAAMFQDHYQRDHKDYGLTLYNQFVDTAGRYSRRFVGGGWGMRAHTDAPTVPRITWFDDLPGKPTSIGVEKPVVRAFISGHSLSSHQGAAYFPAIATSMAVSHQYEQQIILGSPIRTRTGDGSPWTGFQTGTNKAAQVNVMNYLTEWQSPTSVTGGTYTDLLITENHQLFQNLRWNDTVKYLMLYCEAFMARSPGAQPYLWTCWHPGDAGLNSATAAGWIQYEIKMAKVWDAIVYRVNLTAANKGYSWRLKVAPAAYAVAKLLDHAVNDTLPGISQATDSDTINWLFDDIAGNNVHLNSDAGKYYLALLHMSILTKKSPIGAAYPGTLTATQAASLQTVAWQSLLDAVNWYEWTPRTIADVRSYASGDAATTYSARLDPDVDTAYFSATTYASGNPFVFDAATDTAQAGWFTPPPVGSTDPYAMRAPIVGDRYLDWTAGSDGSGTEGSPWNTLSTARVQSLSAGQALFVKGTGAWPNATGGANGTALNRIYVAKWPGFSGGFTFTGAGARLGGGDYWTFHSLSLACVNTGLCLGEDHDFNGGSASQYFQAIDCIGTRSSNSFTDNSGIIFATNGSAVGTEIIRGSYTGQSGSSNNQSLLWFDYAVNLLILGVLVDQCANPFYFKHTNINSAGSPGGVVKNCIIRRAGRYCGAALNYVQYLNCAFDAAILGMDESGGGLAGGNNCTITHCTFLNSDWFMGAQDSVVRGNNVFRNNASLGTSRMMDNPFSGTDGGTSINYTANEGAGTNHYWRASTQRTLAGYKAAYPSQEVNGVAGSIVLVGGSTPGVTPANWAMSSGVGKNAASDGTDCGVDATKLLTVN